jgi:hypothetical protein
MTGDTIARQRQRERVRRYRERRKFYGEPGIGYRITLRVTPRDVAELLAKRYPPIAAALEGGDDRELGRLLDSLEAAFAYDELGSFEDDPSGYVG